MGTNMEWNEERKSSGVGTLFLGILIGAVAGGIAAMLFTPRSGAETREMLRGKAKETQQMVQTRISDVKEKVGKMKEHMKSRAEQEMQSVEQSQ